MKNRIRITRSDGFECGQETVAPFRSSEMISNED